MFLTVLCQGNELSFHVKSNRLSYSGLSAGIQNQKLVFVAGSFQKVDVVSARIKKMPIHHLLGSGGGAGGGQARLAWQPFVSSPVELMPR